MKLYKELKNKFQIIFNTRKRGIEFLFFNITGNTFTFLLNLTLPFFLTSDSYGYFALFFSLFNLGAAIFTFGLDSTIIKFTVEKEYGKSILAISFISWLILTLILIPVLGFISYYITKFLYFKISFYATLVIIIASALIALQRVVLAYYIGKESNKRYGILFITNKVIQFLFIFIIALTFKNDSFLISLPYLFLLQSIVVLIYILITEKDNFFTIIPAKFDIIKIIKFSLPLSLNTIGGVGFSYGFNVLISPFLTLGQLGILNIFTQLSSVASMAINALNNGHISRFYKGFSENPKMAIFNYFKYILLNVIPIFLLVFAMGVFYKFLSYKEIDDYSLLALLIYCIGILFYSFKSIGFNILIINGKTLKISIITVVASIINIALAIFVTKLFGFIGCIVSLAFGYFLQVVVFNYESFKFFSNQRHVGLNSHVNNK